MGNVGVENWKVITKLSEVPEGCGNVSKWVRESIENSLAKLKVGCLEGLLLHRPIQLLDDDKKLLWRALKQLKKDGLVRKIGFSIYTPNELDILWSIYKPDIVQAPYNIFDRRIKNSGWLKRMSDSRVEVHIRSIFLQGLLLIEKTQRPKQFHNWAPLWNYWDDWLKMNRITPLEAALAFALSEDSVKKIIVGIDSELHLNEILSSVKEVKVNNFPKELSVTDENLINPSKWSL